MANGSEVTSAREVYEAFLIALGHELDWHRQHVDWEDSKEYDHGYADGLLRARHILRDLGIHLIPVKE